MTKSVLTCFFAVFLCFRLVGQEAKNDSIHVLNEITVQAFEYNRPLKDIPAAVSIVTTKDFDRFNNSSILPALNSIPGVRMEERSPGSFRLSIRGSTLRSPFGVRNVKVYWNGLPLTDPGGNTYLNILDFSMIGQAEVIKGPSGSLYGAGTGGALLLKSPHADYGKQQVHVATTAGSFGMKRFNVGWQNNNQKSNTTVQYAHQQADGYREQSKMLRDVFLAQGNFVVDDKRVIAVNLIYSDLFYQTPGALTKIQYDTLPEQARPSAGSSRSAVEQKATVFNKTFYSAVSHEYQLTKKWFNRTGFYGTFTKFENPTIRNYERKTEQSFGLRSATEFSVEQLKLNFGGEYQQGFTPIRVYENNSGNIGALQNDDEIKSASALLFVQADFSLPRNFFLTAGGSYNFYTIGFRRFTPSLTKADRNFNPLFSPRIALLKKLNSIVSIYGSFSKGFSPPTLEELYPSTSVFDQNLKAETGTNYEVGLKGGLLDKTLLFDVTYYILQLKQTIVSRRDTTMVGDPEYFINAGRTSQKGLEVNVSWVPRLKEKSFLQSLKIWTSYTLNHYRFKNYSKGDITYSGNKLTGTPPTTFVAGLDLALRKGIYTNITFSYTDHIALNDSNGDFAKPYTLFGARMGYRYATANNFPIDIFLGVDNAFDVKYSLGNDLNAVGNRFYNAAAPRNFYIGLKSNLLLTKK